MHWLAFACSFPSGSSTLRVGVWRRLRRAGAVAPKTGLHLLPATDDCLETMQWIAQEARSEGAEPLVIHADVIEGVTEQQLINLFHGARREDYVELSARAADLESAVAVEGAELASLGSSLERLRADYIEVQRIDYFDAPEGRLVGARINALAASFATPGLDTQPVPIALRPDYQRRIWVTRPRPFVDRVACAWLIRRFIDDDPTIRYSERVTADEVAFDMTDATFGHVGNRCSFEVLIEAFQLQEPALVALAEIVHQLDLQDGRYARPEAVGFESVLNGWRESERSDEVIEAAGLDLLDGLYSSLRRSHEGGSA